MVNFKGRDQCLVSQDWSALLCLATLNLGWEPDLRKGVEGEAMGLFIVGCSESKTEFEQG